MPRDWDADNLRNSDKYSREITRLFMLLAQEASQIGISVNELLPDRPFSFADFPKTKAQADKILKKLTTNLESIIVNGVRSAWTLANNKNNELARRIFGNNVGKLSPTQYRRYFTNNEPARDAFIKRKTDGLTLSDRVWRYAQQFKAEIELGLDIGIRNGLSAQEMARDLKQYLQEPEKLFRRVRDQHGNLALSKAAKAYHPGQGVYRSSHKNAMRLSRTENNMAYRYADFERWNNFDFVVGVEIRLSNNPNHCPMCAALAGKYRKDFKFGGWHPQCRCRALPILKTVEEMQKETDAILAGLPVPKDSVNTVSDMPAVFKGWYAKNLERIDRAANKPYWLRDNEALINSSQPKPIKGPVPEKLAGYESKYGLSINREIFNMLNKEVPLKHDAGKGAFYDPVQKIVNIPLDRRREKSKWYAEAVVYHEYGHAVDWQEGLRNSQDVTDLMDKYRAAFKKNRNELFKSIDQKLWESGRKAFKDKNYDLLEKTGAAQDTLMSLNQRYGAGHRPSYWRSPGKPAAEFIAHMFENKFAGNEIFKQFMPELYKDMIKLADKIMEKTTK